MITYLPPMGPYRIKKFTLENLALNIIFGLKQALKFPDYVLKVGCHRTISLSPTIKV